MTYFLAFAIAFGLSLILTPQVRKLAKYLGVMDMPNQRKVHTKPIARMGGVAIFVAFLLPLVIFLQLNRHLLGFLGGALIVLLVGLVDDFRGLSPWVKLFWQIIAAVVALAGGIGIISISSPLGGTLSMEWGRFAVHLGQFNFHITPIANLLSLIWIVGIINTINFLDGLDGLAGGVSAIAAVVIFFLAVSLKVNQPEIALISIILAGAIIGFLPYNFNPATIIMGDSGAYFLGLTLALLAIYSGSKVATVCLVLGFTIVDGIWTVLRRLYAKTPIFKADRRHLHHLLLDLGLSQRSAVIILYIISSLFGLMALFLGSFAKLITLLALIVIMIILISALVYLINKKAKVRS